jgi:TolB-like protein/Tfp pilus assembly protein PilF
VSDPQSIDEAETTWQRLLRRKVGQWGIAYVAAAWGFLQGLEYVGEAFGWPEYLRRIAILVLLTGLPMVLVIAWHYGEGGRQRITRSEILILSVLLVAGALMTWRFHDAGEAPVAPVIAPAVTFAAPSAAFSDPRPSIAVLPFENRSAVPEDAFFADGMHDDILTRLARIGAVRVIARTSVAQLRGTRLGTREIGATLGVRNVLVGAVQRAADRVRISVQLIDTEQDTQLWGENFDRELSAANIFDIQGEVATAIAGALNIALTGSAQSLEPAVPTQNLAAWEAFQRGEAAGPEEAVDFFQRAVDLDPQFARAHAALAGALSRQVFLLGARRDVVLPRAEAAVEAALLLDPGLAEAWLVLGNVALDDRAEPAYRKAVELNPNFSRGWEHLSDLRRDMGHWEEALEYAERAAALDPLSVGIHGSLAASYESLGRFDQAEQHYRKTIELDPASSVNHMLFAHFLAIRNRFTEAMPLAERAVAMDPGNAWLPGELAALYADFGDDVAALRVLEPALRRWPDRTNLLAVHGWFSVRQGNQVAAVRDARRLLDSNPGHWAPSCCSCTSI